MDLDIILPPQQNSTTGISSEKTTGVKQNYDGILTDPNTSEQTLNDLEDDYADLDQSSLLDEAASAALQSDLERKK